MKCPNCGYDLAADLRKLHGEKTNYPDNKIHWKVGDVVIHDFDVKNPHLLMKVIKVQKNGLIVTKYIDPDIMLPRRNVRFKNDLRFLHNPAKFGIVVSEPESKGDD